MKRISRKKILWFIVVVALCGALFLYWQAREAKKDIFNTIELGIVERGTVEETLSETGVVQSVQSVDLAFERGGRIAHIYHKEGDMVEAGAILMALDTTQLESEVVVARARLLAEQLRLAELERGADAASVAVTEAAVTSARAARSNAERSLAEVTTLQNQLVANAEKVLRSSGLQAYLVSKEQGGGSYDSPTVTGTYVGSEEGVYTITLYNSGASSGSSFRLTGLETGGGTVSTIAPTPIGTRGLYVQFPDDFAARTVWEIPIPNTRSSTYLANLTAYQAVVETRNVTIANAENAVRAAESALNQALAEETRVKSSARDERIAAQRALVTQMTALLAQAETALHNASLRAPFAGVVTVVATEVGQVVSPNVPLVSVHTDADHQLVVEISEVDIAEVNVGDKASVTFDAFEDLVMSAVVTKVAPSATVVSGLRIFTVTLAFTETSERLRAGLTAEIDITTAVREDVIAIPTRAVYQEQAGKFVRAVTPERNIQSVPVTTGLRGTNGMTEIVSGLQGGEEIIMFATEEDLARITE